MRTCNLIENMKWFFLFNVQFYYLITGTLNRVATVIIVCKVIYIWTCIPLCHNHVIWEIKWLSCNTCIVFNQYNQLVVRLVSVCMYYLWVFQLHFVFLSFDHGCNAKHFIKERTKKKVSGPWSKPVLSNLILLYAEPTVSPRANYMTSKLTVCYGLTHVDEQTLLISGYMIYPNS